MQIWTVGHSNHPLETFLGLLTAHAIQTLADVRSFRSSRKYPHFNEAPLAATLAATGIAYHALPALGGRRKPTGPSHNTAWRNESFRAFADYMETAEFRAGVEQLIELANQARTAFMCAEAVWWRCHRGLIADYLKAQGVEVWHILSTTKTQLHPYTSAAQVTDGRLSYVAPAPAQRDLGFT